MATAQPVSLTTPNAASMLATLEDTVRHLCTMDAMNGRYRIGMPVILASGSMVDVSVWSEGNAGTFMVSDDGCAHREVIDNSLNERAFARVARLRAQSYGAAFDGHSMLFLRVDAARLKAAIATIASLVKEVVDEVVHLSMKERHASQQALLLDRLGEAFPKAHIEPRAIITGGSTALHDIDALVETQHGAMAFDLFTKDGNSINAAFLKLSDIAKLTDGPRPIGVTDSLDAIGPKLSLIRSVAKVIEVGAPKGQFAHLLRAA